MIVAEPAIDTTTNLEDHLILAAACLDAMQGIEAGSVDMVFADLPYGTTQNPWDVVIPFGPLWEQLNRICKPTAPMVFTAMQPFTSMLVASNLKAFRYEIIWKKNKATGFLNAKRQPLRTHENVEVFYRESPIYTPQMTDGHPPAHAVKAVRKMSGGTNYGKGATAAVVEAGSTIRHPNSVLEIPVVNNDDPERIHPTQKPEALVAWFIRTYTQPGDLILDPVLGSGTTSVAAKRLGRRSIGIEMDPEMAEQARARVRATVSL